MKKSYQIYFLIFLLGGVAGVIRYSLTQFFKSPLTLILINFVGIFLLVFFVKTILPKKNINSQSLTAWGVGFLGGLTTVATPLLDLTRLFLSEDYLGLSVGLIIYVLGGILVAFVAQSSANLFVEKKE